MATAPTEQRSTNRRIAGRTVDGEPRADFEISRKAVARIRKAAAAAHREAARAAARNSDGTLPKRSRGRPPKPGSRRDIAKRTGISSRQQQRFEKHVALAEEHPLFKDAHWKMADALEAGALLRALSPDQRVEVVPRLASLDPPSVLRLLHTLAHTPGSLVPDRPAQASPTPSPSAPDLATTVPASPAPVTAEMPSQAELRLLVAARWLVGSAAGLVSDTELFRHLRQVENELSTVVLELGHGAPVPMPRLERRASARRLLAEAETLVLQAAQRLSHYSSVHPRVHERLRRVAAAINAALRRLPSLGEDADGRHRLGRNP